MYLLYVFSVSDMPAATPHSSVFLLEAQHRREFAPKRTIFV